MKHFTRGALLKIFCRKNSQNSQKSIWMDGCVFSTVSGLHLAIFFKKGFHLRCFSVNIAKSIKTVVKLCVKNNQRQHIFMQGLLLRISISPEVFLQGRFTNSSRFVIFVLVFQTGFTFCFLFFFYTLTSCLEF